MSLLTEIRRSGRLLLELLTVITLATLASTSSHAQAVRLLTSHMPAGVRQARLQGRFTASRPMHLAISLPLRNEQELDALISDISDPSSPNYRHFISSAEFAARFSPTAADYTKVIKYLQSQNLTVTGLHSNRLVVSVAGAVPDVERAFNVHMMVYNHPTRGQFYSPDREPSVNADVAIEHVSGLSDFNEIQPMSLQAQAASDPHPYTTGSGPYGLLIGKDFRAAYAPDVQQTGSGETVALLEFDGFYASDVAANFAAAGMTPIPVQTVLLDGFNGTPGGNNLEVTMDIMMAAYMAPGLKNIMVYEGTTPDDILDRIATDDKAKQISSSWGFGTDATTDEIFKQFIVQGQTFLQASGDSGGYTSVVMTPSDDPNITVVGGTNLSTGGGSGPWSSESAWSGSGGGVSTVWPIPAYQQNMSMAASGGSTKMRNLPDVAANAGTGAYLVCNNGKPYNVGGTSEAAPLWAGFVALANQEAAENQRSPVGFLNPRIYALGNSGYYSSSMHDITSGNDGTFHTVTGYDLATGWGTPAGQPLVDALSEAGGPGFSIAAAQSSMSVSQAGTATDTITINGYNGFSGAVTFSLSGLPSGVEASFNPATVSAQGRSTVLTLSASNSIAVGSYQFSITGTSGSTTFSTQVTVNVTQPSFTLAAAPASLTVAAGAGASTNISIVGQGGFNGTVDLSVSGLPSGLSASFNPSSTSTGSALNLSAASTLAPGSYALMVTGTSGSTTASETITVTVPQPNYSLAAQSSFVTVFSGSSPVSDAIAVVAGSGFSGSVAFTASGLPAGLTASFSPAASASGTTITFSPSASLRAGSYSITVSGALGSTVAKTAITVIIPAQAFSLTAGSSNLSLSTAGAATSEAIHVVPTDGFTGTVAFNVSGLPAGTTAGFSPVSSATGSTLTLSSSSSAIPGTYQVSVTGTSGAYSATVPVEVTIPQSAFTLSSSISSATLLVNGPSVLNRIAINDGPNFSGEVSFTVSGVPAGLTASLNYASSKYGTALTLKPTANLAPGNYLVTVTGVSGTQSASTSIPVTVPKPSFGLTAASMTETVPVGGSEGFDTFTVTSPENLANLVAFAVSGLPPGMTAHFNYTTSSTASSLWFFPSTAMVPGNYTVTVTGTADGVTVAVPVTFIVPQPGFTLTSSIASMTLVPGSSYRVSTIRVVGENNFKGTVDFTASGLPDGLTASFNPASTASGSTTIALTPQATLAPGNYTVTIHGVSGSASGSTSLTVIVPQPSITLAAASSSVTAQAGGRSVSNGIKVASLLNYTGSVAFTATDLPQGMTAAFSYPESRYGSTLILTPSAAVAPGTYTVAVHGSGGGATTSIPVVVTVTR